MAIEMWYNRGRICLPIGELLVKDTTDHAVEETFCSVCRRMVRSLMERNDWRLVSEDDLLKRVMGSLRGNASTTECERLAKFHYSEIIYEACRQTRDSKRRERPWTELRRYLYRAAYNRWPAQAEDATQRALMLVYEQIDRCRNPGTFLAFALVKLQQAITDLIRELDNEETAREVLLEKLRGEIKHSPSLVEQECRQCILDAIECLRKRLMKKVILLRYFAGLKNVEIAEYLEITPNYVGVLLNRGRTQLRRALDKRREERNCGKSCNV